MADFINETQLAAAAGLSRTQIRQMRIRGEFRYHRADWSRHAQILIARDEANRLLERLDRPLL